LDRDADPDYNLAMTRDLPHPLLMPAHAFIGQMMIEIKSARQ
jgi:hypothetical protein